MPEIPTTPYLGLAVLCFVSSIATAASPTGVDVESRVERVLTANPLIDGHNDLPARLYDRFKGKLSAIELSSDTSKIPLPPGEPALMTDIPRLRAGHVGAQFWSVWVPAGLAGYETVQRTIEQIDLVKQMAARYPADLEIAYTAADIRRIHKAKRIASLIGIEGGHQINNSLAVLRQMYDLGARYMTLTHTKNNDWADSATDMPAHQGLTSFGKEVVREMNRVGMLVDLSHVSPEAMRVALAVTEAPVIFSHSSARALLDHPRNVPDDILRLTAKNGGIVMVNFIPEYISDARNRWEADRAAEQTRFNSPPYAGLYIGQPERARAALAEWDKAHPKPPVTLAQVADHIEHVRQIAGVDHVGIGSDFDGSSDFPLGLTAVDRFPVLLAELMRRGWTDDEVTKLAGSNLLRVLAAADMIGARLRRGRAASSATVPELDGAVAGTR